MKSKLPLLILLVILPGILAANIKPVRLTCEYLNNPMAIDTPEPRLSWINSDDAHERGQRQIAFEIRVAGSREGLLTGKADLWESGKIISGESVNIPYRGKQLKSGQDCWWQVRVWDRKRKKSEWSNPAFWSMGLLEPGDWKAQWIGAPWQDEAPLPKPPAPKRANQTEAEIPGSLVNCLIPPPC